MNPPKSKYPIDGLKKMIDMLQMKFFQFPNDF